MENGNTLLTGQLDSQPAAEGEQAQGEGQTTEQQGQQAQGEEGGQQGGEQGQQQGDAASSKQGEGEKGKEAAKPAAPEKYEFKAPEGMTLDAELLGEFEGVAKELGLTQEAAQKQVDLGAKLVQKVATKQQEALNTLYTEVFQGPPEKWSEMAKADKELNDGGFKENLAHAKRGLSLVDPAFAKMLDKCGWGNHPAVLRSFARLGKQISEDGNLVKGGATQPRDAADVLYGKTSQKAA